MKTKNYNILIITCFLFMISIGILSIYSASVLIGTSYSNLYIKQITSIITGIIIMIFLIIIGNEKMLKYSKVAYITSIFLLTITLFIGKEINGSKCWLTLGGITFQPSEFMKISLILLLSEIIEKYHFKNKRNTKEELKLIITTLIITLIPSFLVFIEPDTGSVIMYILIWLTLLFISPLRNRWIIILITFITLLFSSFILTYIFYPDILIKIFSSSIFYRIDRILNWQISEGMQLENSLIAIGTGGFKGTGLTNTPIYIPEAYSDFIFPIYANNFGLIGVATLICIIIIFNLISINKIINTSKTVEKYLITGVIITLIFSQIQNIGMTLGLLPIMGIPLPYISYGGSSIITYTIFIAFVINTNRKKSHTLSKQLK